MGEKGIKLIISLLLLVTCFSNYSVRGNVVAEENQDESSIVLDSDDALEVQPEASDETENIIESQENQGSEDSTDDEVKTVEENEKIIDENTEINSNLQNNAQLETTSISTNALNQPFIFDNIKYKVLTEDSNSKTGTVQVGTAELTLNSSATSCNAMVDCSKGDSLTIPNEITNNGYTYTVTQIAANAFSSSKFLNIELPSTINKIGAQAFSSSKVNKLDFKEGLTEIYAKAFINSEIEVVTIPKTITNLYGGLFSGCAELKTIYLNANPATTKFPIDSSVTTNNPFSTLNYLNTVVITANESEFGAWKNRVTNEGSTFLNLKGCLTYEMKMEFVDRDLKPIVVDKEIYALYLRSIKWVKQVNGAYNDKASAPIPMPDLPKNLGYDANYWGISPLAISVINENGVVEAADSFMNSRKHSDYTDYVDSPYLVAVEEKFKITMFPSIDNATVDRAYNGESGIYAAINRNFGNYLDADRAFKLLVSSKDDGKTFSWRPDFENNGNYIYTGIDDVVDSGEYRIGFKFENMLITEGSATVMWNTDIPTSANTLGQVVVINIKPAEISVHPKTETRIVWSNQQALPEIKFGDNDLDGSISWDLGQTPLLGRNSYTYTYIPDNLVGQRDFNSSKTSNNFTSDEFQGTIEIEYYEKSATPVPDYKPDTGPVIIPTEPVPTPTVISRPARTPKPTSTPAPVSTESPSETPDSTKVVNSKTDAIINEVEKVEIKTQSGNKIFDNTLNIYIEKSNSETKNEIEKKVPNLLNSFDIIVEENGIKINKNVLNEPIIITIDYEQYENYKNLKVLQNKDGEYIELNYEIIYDGNTPTAIQFTSDSADGIAISGVEVIQQGFNWWWIIGIIGITCIVFFIVIVVKKINKEE